MNIRLAGRTRPGTRTSTRSGSVSSSVAINPSEAAVFTQLLGRRVRWVTLSIHAPAIPAQTTYDSPWTRLDHIQRTGASSGAGVEWAPVPKSMVIPPSSAAIRWSRGQREARAWRERTPSHQPASSRRPRRKNCRHTMQRPSPRATAPGKPGLTSCRTPDGNEMRWSKC
jgi:hypothetical protein